MTLSVETRDSGQYALITFKRRMRGNVPIRSSPKLQWNHPRGGGTHVRGQDGLISDSNIIWVLVSLYMLRSTLVSSLLLSNADQIFKGGSGLPQSGGNWIDKTGQRD